MIGSRSALCPGLRVAAAAAAEEAEINKKTVTSTEWAPTAFRGAAVRCVTMRPVPI